MSETNGLQKFDISHEEWREYEWEGKRYRIDNPKTLYLRPGGTTHRVVDEGGVVHCVPAVGRLGCVLRWRCQDGFDPVQF